MRTVLARYEGYNLVGYGDGGVRVEDLKTDRCSHWLSHATRDAILEAPDIMVDIAMKTEVTLVNSTVQQSIETRYLCATNTKPSRIAASTTSGRRLIGSYNTDLVDKNAHWQVVAQLANSLGWTGKMVCGSTKRGYVFVFTEE